jgi:hypothetical protein
MTTPDWMIGFVPKPNLWQPGQSGNPAGKKKGTRHRKTIMGQAIVDQVQEVLDVVISRALNGDMTAAGLLIARVIPTLRPRAEKVEFPLDTRGSLLAQGEQVLQAIANAELAPDVGKSLLDSLGQFATLKQVDDLSERIGALEQRASATDPATRGAVMIV